MKEVMDKLKRITVLLMPVGITVLSLCLLSQNVFADSTNVVDQINITVPVSCTMSGTGMNSHNAEISNGTYQADIGTTTLHAFCNDAEGFAIYAAGYTGNEIEGTNSDKLVGTSASGNATINTGLATSAGSPDASNWAMKLAITGDSGDTTSTNAFSIDSDAEGSFSSYHTVPNDYTKVAHKNAMTDMTASTGGVKLTTTYATYISKTQPADTYSGQVIYTLVHPASTDPPVHPDQIGVNYYSNGLTFAGGATKNRVIYNTSCTPMYIATTPTILKTSNLNEDGTKNGPYTNNEYIDEVLTFDGASKVKIIVKYDVTKGSSIVEIYKGDWIDEVISWDQKYFDMVGDDIYIFDINEAAFYFQSWNHPSNDHDYGFYAAVYPMYDTPQNNTEEISYCSYVRGSGSYAETTEWNGRWYTTHDGKTVFFADETEITEYLKDNVSPGETVDIYAYNPYQVIYNGNGATAGTMSGFTTDFATNDSNSSSYLIAPNFKKTGYGFAGWSADPNAKANDNSKIFGPNEAIHGNELNFDLDDRRTTLYAVWVPSSGDMQNFSCSSLGPGQVTALADARDNNVYAVGKMQDGNCWMMENMRIDNSATINSTNTNNPASGFVLAPTRDSWCPGNDTSCRNRSYINTNNTNIGGTDTSGELLTVAPGGWDFFRAFHEDDYNGELGYAGISYQWYGYGNQYNWYSAMAGRTNASGNLCPSNWTIPGYETSSITFKAINDTFFDMENAHNETELLETQANHWFKYPNNFVYSGYSDKYRGVEGVYYYGELQPNGGTFSFYVSKLRVSNMYGVDYYGHTFRCATR